MTYPLPDNEEQRIKALAEYQLLDTMPEQEYDDIVKMAAEMCGTPISAIALIDSERKWHKAKYNIDKQAVPRSIAICAHTITDGKTLIANDTHLHPYFKNIGMVTKPPHVRFYAGIPLIMGTLCALDTQPRTLTEQQIADLEALARFVTSLFELCRALLRQQLQNELLHSYQQEVCKLNEQLHSQSLTDELTGLYNRRAFNREIKREVTLFKRYKTPLSLLMVDIDGFKHLNDRLGHTAGDDALQQLSQLMQDSIRDADILARYGGEEFSIIMPRTDLPSARLTAERIRRHIAKSSGHALTVSIGVCTAMPLLADNIELVKASDRALYRARQQDRNRVCIAEDSDYKPESQLIGNH